MIDDLWLVRNICVGDDSVDPMYGYSHKDYFEVRWDGKPLRIPPGETRIVEEYLADHFAKHLIDYLLMRDGKMMHNDKLREVLLPQIKLRKADESDNYQPATGEGTGEPNIHTPPAPTGDTKLAVPGAGTEETYTPTGEPKPGAGNGSQQEEKSVTVPSTGSPAAPRENTAGERTVSPGN